MSVWCSRCHAGKFLPWFHGLISRKEAERLLAVRPVGCFLVRLSENRFGYTLSYRIRTRCRHYMVEQDAKGRYALVGVEKVLWSSCCTLPALQHPLTCDGVRADLQQFE